MSAPKENPTRSPSEAETVGHKARPTSEANEALDGSGFPVRRSLNDGGTPENSTADALGKHAQPTTPPRTGQSRSLPPDSSQGRDDLPVVRTAAKSNAPDASPTAYTFTPRVLGRWAKKNLQFTADENDGGGQAEFRFHGSTCGNIEFDLLYHVKVGSADSGWPIIEQRCEPAPHGDGHTHMCCWRENYAMVEDWMSREAPLTGEPLAAAITWKPTKSASGCLCHVDGRMHKWNAVLQTLHFALSKTTNPS